MVDFRDNYVSHPENERARLGSVKSYYFPANCYSLTTIQYPDFTC